MKKIFSIIAGLIALHAGAQNVGIGTTTPKARLHVADSSVLFTGPDVLPSNPAPPPMQGPGKRLMWYADKAAFRLGSVFDNSWDKDSIGIGSIVFGNGGKADGNFAMAIGSGSIVKSTLGISIGLSNFIDTGANFSMSMGNSNRIKGSQSFAFGNTNFMDTAADFSISMGNSNLIQGRNSFVIGNFNRTGADFAQAYGTLNNLLGRSSVALGNGLTMPAFRGVSIGSFNSFFQQLGGSIWFDQDPLLVVGNGRDDANRSTAITVLKNGNTGIGTTAPNARLHVADSSVFFSSPSSLNSGRLTPTENGGTGLLWIAGKAALRVGRETGIRWAYDNIGVYSSSFGFNNRVSGTGGFASGYNNIVSDLYGIALGSENHAQNQGSVAIGRLSQGLGDFSNAIGYGAAALAFQSTALGRYNFPNGNATSDLPTDPILVVGNGTDDNNRSNALTILKNGNIGMGNLVGFNNILSNLHVFGDQRIEGTGSNGGQLDLHSKPGDYTNGSTIRFYYSPLEYLSEPNSATRRSNFFVKLNNANASTNLAGAFAIGQYFGSFGPIPSSESAGMIFNQEGQVGIRKYPIKSESATVKVDIEGATRINGGLALTGIGEASGKLLVSNASGNATWQNPPKITVDQAGAAGIPSLEFRNGGAYRGGFGWDQSTGRFFFFDGESGTNTFFINNGRMGIQRNPTTNDFEVNGNASKATAGSWLGNSDARLKKDMQPLTGALDKLKQLEGITFQWNDTKTGMKRPEGNQMGFTAQNIQQVFPEAVSTDAQGYLQTAYGTYDALLVESIKALLKKIEVLEQKVKTLENK